MPTERTDGEDRQMDGRQTVILRFPIDAASLVRYEDMKYKFQIFIQQQS